MATTATEGPRPSRLSSCGTTALLLLLAAVLIRCWQYGNPVIQVDDHFYLLVADRWLHQGQLPYVDMWDRKPLGTFLVYLGIRLLGGDGIIQYQLVATAFAAATAYVIARISLPYTRPLGALAAGIVYLLWLQAFGGDGGQTPVFYNLPVSIAALITARTIGHARPKPQDILTAGCAAMLLLGLAIQIKYTAVFEGVFLGLLFSHVLWKRSCHWTALVGAVALWAGIALLPTLGAIAWFAAIGHGDAFLHANFVSVFARQASDTAEVAERLFTTLARLSPLIVAAAVSLHRLPPQNGEEGAARLRFVHHWLIAAFIGVAVFGTYYDHYTLPLLVPLSAACAPLLGHPRFGGRATILLVLIGIGLSIHVVGLNKRRRGNAADVANIVRELKPFTGKCIYIYDSEPIFYHYLKSCVPTRFIFPDHLSNKIEAGALGVDTVAEVRRIVATRPRAIMFRTPRPQPWRLNHATDRVVQQALRRHYRLYGRFDIGRRQLEVWTLNEAR